MRSAQGLSPSFMGALAVLAVSLALGGSAHATTLQTLIDQNGIVVGDKLFNNFTLDVNGIGSYHVDPAAISVIGITGGPDYGIRFESVVPGAPIITADPNSSLVDVLIGFDVTVLDPRLVIHDLGLSLAAHAPADGFVQVVESALAGAIVVGQIQVEYPQPTSAHLDFSPLTFKSLHIFKDVLVLAGATEPSVVYSIDQTFSQIPEPATLTLLGFGTVALLRARRTRRALRILVTRGSLPMLALAMLVSGLAVDPTMATPLQTLASNPSNSITQADKVFDHFTVSVAGQGRFFADPAAIDVLGTTIGGEHGLKFAGAIAAFSKLVPNSSVTVNIGFDVTVTDPHWLIDDMTLSFNGARTTPDGIVKIDEQVRSGSNLVGTAMVAAPAPLSDHIMLNGTYTTLHIQKEITVYGGANGVGSISFINQTFSQIPEPTTLALLALTIPAMIRRRHRR